MECYVVVSGGMGGRPGQSDLTGLQTRVGPRSRVIPSFFLIVDFCGEGGTDACIGRMSSVGAEQHRCEVQMTS